MEPVFLYITSPERNLREITERRGTQKKYTEDIYVKYYVRILKDTESQQYKLAPEIDVYKREEKAGKRCDVCIYSLLVN